VKAAKFHLAIDAARCAAASVVLPVSGIAEQPEDRRRAVLPGFAFSQSATAFSAEFLVRRKGGHGVSLWEAAQLLARLRNGKN